MKNYIRGIVTLSTLFLLIGCEAEIKLATENVEIYIGQEFDELAYLDDDTRINGDLVVQNNVDVDETGTYQVIYTLGGSEKTLTVKVNEDPISLLTTSAIVELGSDFDPLIYVSEEDKKNDIKIDNVVKSDVEGSYAIKYSFDGVEKLVTVKVQKVTLALKEKSVTIDYGSTFDAKKYIESNFIDSNSIQIDSKVDTSKLGDYKVIYSLNDENYELDVTVKDVSPILLNNSVSLTKDSRFNPKEYLIDADKKNTAIKIENSVDMSNVGVYTVTYTLGNVIKNLEVTVKEKAVIVISKPTSPTTPVKPTTPVNEKPPIKTPIKVASFTNPVNAGEIVTLRIKATPNTTYSISVYYSSGPSKAEGLDSKTSDGEGYVQWTWKVGSRTKAGSYNIAITSNVDSFNVSLVVK